MLYNASRQKTIHAWTDWDEIITHMQHMYSFSTMGYANLEKSIQLKRTKRPNLASLPT